MIFPPSPKSPIFLKHFYIFLFWQVSLKLFFIFDKFRWITTFYLCYNYVNNNYYLLFLTPLFFQSPLFYLGLKRLFKKQKTCPNFLREGSSPLPSLDFHYIFLNFEYITLFSATPVFWFIFLLCKTASSFIPTFSKNSRFIFTNFLHPSKNSEIRTSNPFSLNK